MKTILKISIALFIASLLSGQSPDLFNYQGMAFDESGNAVINQSIDIRLSILEAGPTGSVVYQEEHQVTTSSKGIFSLQIGGGNNVSGQFSSLGWGQNRYWIATELDINNQGYQLLGTHQFVSVPYAMHATTVENSDDADADPSNEIQSLNLSGNHLSLSGANTITLPSGTGGLDEDPANELQSLTKNGNMIALSQGGGSVTDEVNDADADPTNELQSLTSQKNGNDITISISDGQSTQFSVDDQDNDPNNELQSLSLVGDQLSISGTNTITLPSGNGGLDEDPGNEIQNLIKIGNMIELSMGGGSVIDEVDDADADPTNEIQTLTLNGNDLAISNGNNINLSSFENHWTDDNMFQGILYDSGSARLTNNTDQIVVQPYEIYGNASNHSKNFSIDPYGAFFSDDMTAVASSITNEEIFIADFVNGPSTYMHNNGLDIYAEECQTELQNGILAMQDTLGLANTFYAKDSLYYYGSVGGLAFPDIAVLKPTHIKFETLGNGLKSTLGPGAQYNYSDNFRSSLISDELRIEETTQPDAFDRVVLNGDGLQLTNSAKWKTAEITSNNTFGGSLKLNNPSGTPLVHIGANEDTLFGNLPTGNIFLNDIFGNARISMSVFEGNGISMIENDTTYVFTGLGGVTAGALERGLLDILDGKAEIKYDPNRDAGAVTLWGASNSNQIAYMGPINGQHGAGQLNLTNSSGNGEAGLFAYDHVGGLLSLSGNNTFNVFAGGDINGRGYIEVANTDSDIKAGMIIDEFNQGEVYVRSGGQFRIADNMNNDLVNINEDFISYSDDSGTLAFLLGREFDFPNVGFQYMYGENGFANAYIGIDRNTFGDDLGNIGKLELFDREANVRAFMDGYGNICGSDLKVRDYTNSTRIQAGITLFDNSGYLDVIGSNDFANVSMHGQTSGNHGAVNVLDDVGAAQAGMFVDEVTGLGHVYADVKNFRMTHPEHPDQEIWYASLEGPEAGAYSRGKATLVDGEVFVPFPDHFKAISNTKTMTIQLTPRYWDTFGLSVIEITEDGFYVKELKGGKGGFEFDWHATSVRKGFEDYQVIRNHSEMELILSRPTSRTNKQ